ncbi:helix-turn-helix domain-containing protein [Nocardia nova]|uniref:MmyB family transcriptional regulator n=1 Tax=Nocardia nova TaxID=37330 RepID=UPI0037B2B3C4
MISLATWARAIRAHRSLIRREAEHLTGVSADYLKDIESGVPPSPKYLEKLIRGYGLDEAQTRLTWDLWRPPRRLPRVEQLREQATTPDRLEYLALLDRAGIALAYLDPLWNILASNSTFDQALPEAGVNTGGNFALWALPPAPQQSPTVPLLLDPDRERQFLVGMLRGGFARYRDNPQVGRMYRQLSRNHTFAHYWHEGIHVAYGRGFEEPLHLRNPTTRQPYTLDLQITTLSDRPEIRSFIAWPPPQPRPDPD